MMTEAIKRMTDADWDRLDAYVQTIAGRMRLRDWRIELDRTAIPVGGEGSGNRPALATCSVAYGSHIATIRVRESWLGETELDRRESVVHELLHCYTDPWDQTVTDVLEKALPSASCDPIFAAIEYQMEVMTDTLAMLIAERMPPAPGPVATASEEKSKRRAKAKR